MQLRIRPRTTGSCSRWCVVALALAAFAAAVPAEAAEITLNGAGASFPAPVYRVWTYNYGESTSKRIEVNYQSSGSGAGVNQLKDGTVDFGGTDNPLTEQELKVAGLCQFPMLTGGVVVIVNIRGVNASELKLDRAALADIFLGKISNWNDPRLQELNPQIKLPKVRISVVRRSDSSGTTFIFTNYLSKISDEWREKIGCGPAVNWPTGIGGQKNPGVCNNVARINGAIGYTEYTYAVEAKLGMPRLQNLAGEYVAPSVESFRASAAGADWQNAPGFYMVLTDQPGAASWPITGLTYIVMKREQSDAARAKAMLEYFNWCYDAGAITAEKLNYVPLGPEVIALVRQCWQEQLTVNGQALAQ